MKKHHTPIDDNIETTQAPTLPDRSELSKLYFQPKSASVVQNQKASILDDGHIAKTIRSYAVKIGLLIPLPFMAATVPAVLFIIAVSPSNILQMLPLMILTMIAWGIAVVLMFSKVLSYLNRLSVPAFTFLSLLMSCLLLVSQPVFHLAQSIGVFWLGQALFSVSMLFLSFGFCWVFLQLILNDKLTDYRKVKLIGVIVSLCLISAVFYLVAKLA